MNCAVTFTPQNGLGRRKRSAEDDEIEEHFSVPITIYEDGDADDDVDFPVIQIIEDVSVQPVFEGRLLSEDERKILYSFFSTNNQ